MELVEQTALASAADPRVGQMLVGDFNARVGGGNYSVCDPRLANTGKTPGWTYGADCATRRRMAGAVG